MKNIVLYMDAYYIWMDFQTLSDVMKLCMFVHLRECLRVRVCVCARLCVCARAPEPAGELHHRVRGRDLAGEERGGEGGNCGADADSDADLRRAIRRARGLPPPRKW